MNVADVLLATAFAIRVFPVPGGPYKQTEGQKPLFLEHVLDRIDLVCLMSVNPGFGGQKFITSVVEKTANLRAMLGDRPIHIEIDGGVDPQTAPLVSKAGADVLVAGSAVFKGGTVDAYTKNINAIRESVAN